MPNINVTPGSGATVATETIAGVDYQKIKIFDGSTSSVTGLKVNPDGSINASILSGAVSSISGTVSVSSIIGSLPAGSALIGGITSVIGAITPYAQPNAFVSGSPSVFTTTASVQLLSAPGSGLRNYVTHILVTNVGAVATTVNIVDAGVVIYSGFASASGGGFSATLPVPLQQPSSNLGLFSAMTTTSSVIVSASGYKGA